MSTLLNQALGLIETMEYVLKTNRDAVPEVHTIVLARAILDEAKKQVNDPVLKTIDFNSTVPTASGVLAGMRIVANTIK